MGRSRNPGKRKDRQWTERSGTTFSTLPSGVTISSTLGISVAAGNVSMTELSYLDGAGGDVLACDKGTGFSITGASVAWAGTTLQISHGFTTLQGIGVIYVDAQNKSDVSPISCQLIQSAGGDANSTVSAVAVRKIITSNGTSTVLATTGGTVFWHAFGK